MLLRWIPGNLITTVFHSYNNWEPSSTSSLNIIQDYFNNKDKLPYFSTTDNLATVGMQCE